MAERIYLNDGWLFGTQFDESMLSGKCDALDMKPVRIPHTVKETPLHYFDEHEYQMVSICKKA